MSWSAAVNRTALALSLAGSLFPAQLGDLLSAVPLFTCIQCQGSSLKCQESFVRIACLLIFILCHKPQLRGCDGNISTSLSLSLKRQLGRCVRDGELQQCAGDLWRGHWHIWARGILGVWRGTLWESGRLGADPPTEQTLPSFRVKASTCTSDCRSPLRAVVLCTPAGGSRMALDLVA